MDLNTAVLSYPHSNNLGDPIQQIAAEHWIGNPKTESIDREALHLYKGPKIKLLMNGWFMENPTHWPPSPQIAPFFISFHLNPAVENKLLSDIGVAYLKAHQPIGCRDLYTKNRLEQKGIQAYYSSCLTLTLNRSAFVSPKTQRKGILIISPFERLVATGAPLGNQNNSFLQKAVERAKRPLRRKRYHKAMKYLTDYLAQTEETVAWTSQLTQGEHTTEHERRNAAEKQLQAIAKAALVITSRIHSALPAVAFGTPVLFLSDGLEHPNQKSRFEGMESLFPILKSSELNQWIGREYRFSSEKANHLERFEKEKKNFLKIC